jgi:hypothetical protein
LVVPDQSSTLNVIPGVVLIIVAVVALPALMRAAAPLTAVVSNGSGGVMGMGGALAALRHQSAR